MWKSVSQAPCPFIYIYISAPLIRAVTATAAVGTLGARHLILLQLPRTVVTETISPEHAAVPSAKKKKYRGYKTDH